ncbi:MAG TPA: hypothetical protein VKU88_10295 [Acidimicrobiales bacterium]|nr:hypothetical protein [Acidimicrobiales bacterium]
MIPTVRRISGDRRRRPGELRATTTPTAGWLSLHIDPARASRSGTGEQSWRIRFCRRFRVEGEQHLLVVPLTDPAYGGVDRREENG